MEATPTRNEDTGAVVEHSPIIPLKRGPRIRNRGFLTDENRYSALERYISGKPLKRRLISK